MKPLKIAVYYPWVYLKGGIERSMATLISRSRHDWTIFTSHYEPQNTFPEFANFKVVVVGGVTVQRSIGAVLKSAVSIASLKLPLDEFDAYVVWCDGLGTLTTFRNHQIPTFCLCCTPLRAVYDPVYAREARQSRNLLGRVAYGFFERAFRTLDRLAWRHFAGVVAISQEVKQRIVHNQLFPDDSRMVVCYPGVDVTDAPADVKYEPFFLVPGRISWTKNVRLAVEAFKRSGLPAPWRLVVAGFVDQKSRSHLEELSRIAGDNLRIEFVCGPSDELLNQLYRDAYAVLFTALNEDWGITPLEGMLRSKAVVANDSGGPKESITDGVTGWLLKPDVQQWADLLRSLAEQPDTVRRMGAQARLSVDRYDWKRFVSGVDASIERGTCPTPATIKARTPLSTT